VSIDGYIVRGGDMSETLRVPAGEGRAVLVGEGQCFRVVDVAGGQVGDLFAFATADPGEFASASHTRVAIGKLFPRDGDPVLTNRRRPILSVLEDTSPGWHDMLYAACDPARYASLGALAGQGVEAGPVPQPINVFMDVRARPDGTLVSSPASSRPGDYLAFRAVQECIIVLSSCPMDIVPISSGGITPLELQLYESPVAP
jgi:uncharacterized protein